MSIAHIMYQLDGHRLRSLCGCKIVRLSGAQGMQKEKEALNGRSNP
jgi:hypothetical protein